MVQATSEDNADTVRSPDAEPNPADFSVNERSNQYQVQFKVLGYVTDTIEADSEADARDKAQQMAHEGPDWGVDLDKGAEITVAYIVKQPPLYRVLRGEQVMQVSRLLPGDKPREPTTYDF